jgi:hypothetical protein
MDILNQMLKHTSSNILKDYSIAEGINEIVKPKQKNTSPRITSSVSMGFARSIS